MQYGTIPLKYGLGTVRVYLQYNESYYLILGDPKYAHKWTQKKSVLCHIDFYALDFIDVVKRRRLRWYEILK